MLPLSLKYLFDCPFITMAGPSLGCVRPCTNIFYRAPVYVNNWSHPKSACQCHSGSPISHNPLKKKYCVVQWAWLACQVTIPELGPGNRTPGWLHRHELWSNLGQLVNPLIGQQMGEHPKRETLGLNSRGARFYLGLPHPDRCQCNLSWS